MVISYSIKELYSIGEMVVLRDCLAQMQNNMRQNNSNNNSSINSTDSETASASNHSFNHTNGSSPTQNQDKPNLSAPVAQFFEKLEHSCHFQPQMDIQVDVNKVRLHSEVESELFSCSSRP